MAEPINQQWKKTTISQDSGQHYNRQLKN